jgi:hypothetical protein
MLPWKQKLILALASFLFLPLRSDATASQPQASPVPAAPVPSQIVSAKKVFISNQLGALYLAPHTAEDDPYRPYNQFYAALKDWGHFELVDRPADADLVLEISLADRTVFTNAMVQASDRLAYFILVLRDPKSQTVLWWLAERLQGANRPATGEKNYNQAMANLLNDLKKLTSEPSVTPTSSSK